MFPLPTILFEFHVSRLARQRYQFDETLFAFNGNVVFANFHAARRFAQQMNAHRDLAAHPEQAVRAGQLNAMGLIDEILHIVVERYRQQRNPQVMASALDWLYRQVGQAQVNSALRQFAAEFPPIAVYRGQLSLEDYLAGASPRPDGESVQNRQIVLEELIMLWLANANPAFSPFQELFDDASMARDTAYPQVIASLRDFFVTQPPFGPRNQNLIDMLRSPALASPHSLEGQLEYVRSHWSDLVGDVLFRLLSSLDLIKEESKPVFGPGGPGPALVYEFTGLEYAELERFSTDLDWMPNLVLIAKNAYVWLDQLSRKYDQPLTHLDQVPDEELDILARWGITGLWLIGLWERSPASRTIKQLRGNPEAVASAYSLYGYDIAADLGGEDAYQELRRRAWQRGIRLASDMVPNHMGVDSPWVIQHPDWFISLDHPPFPSYTFNGPNLSWDGRVGLFIEDHYYDGTDAAVVFKRIDFWTGSQKYIYHGNDGTSMPWNDTAQLNYLLPEVREAVIQTILHVARKFPIIRFDAAMTLAKRHYHRLWFPEPGSGGDIPSRAGLGLSKAAFDQAFPQEFWREVVDRVAQEAPDTLLLAEAFWLMEGYFVRTLGMHRVYNSAFMNMLRDEKNQEYRLVIKNTLEFDPEILKRYVNFMNNPDERTAVDQFGKGDKYFGICTLMATMPGLPMFGHGQVEGYTEKYGMEYRRAYWHETPDEYLVERHQREIFPLLRRRYLFAEVQNFLLFDFYTSNGNVNEDVFAYSNRFGAERSLVVYNNRYAEARGWIRLSAAYPVKTGQGDERVLVQKTLGQGLDLHEQAAYYTIFRDAISGLEYLRNSLELCQQGLYIELGAYQCRVFLDFREVEDVDGGYARLAAHLQGGAVPDLDKAYREFLLLPLLTPFRELVNAGMFRWLIDNRQAVDDQAQSASAREQALDEAQRKVYAVLEAALPFTAGSGQPAAGDPSRIADQVRRDLQVLLSFPALAVSRVKAVEDQLPLDQAWQFLRSGPAGRAALASGDSVVWGVLLAWCFTRRLGSLLGGVDDPEQSRTWIDEWLLGKVIASALQDLGLDWEAAERSLSLLRLLVGRSEWYRDLLEQETAAYSLLSAWFADPDTRHFLKVHRFEETLWFNKEAFEELCWWMCAVNTLHAYFQIDESEQAVERLREGYLLVQRLLKAEAQSGYQVEKLLEILRA